ncbi:hypothetical protein EJ08DRAFT_230677 [Tothia fuscella]|uniref:DUF6604 domain-containing protein n=1 Tax=Tothia fuscella TaxID=1048955 RepID=A0A9P4P2R8_9PEZI|nr:hypothetical protein EJ08DRAFT_230677 [Tothia fuscella]
MDTQSAISQFSAMSRKIAEEVKDYGKDTKIITHYLVSTAFQHGYQSTKSAAASSGSSKKRKNKTKKNEYTVQSHEYVNMAQWIASQPKVKRISACYGRALTRAIELRSSVHSSHALNHGTKARAKDLHNDDTHWYFIDILYRVAEILEPKMEKGSFKSIVKPRSERPHPSDTSKSQDLQPEIFTDISESEDDLEIEAPERATNCPAPSKEPEMSTETEFEIDGVKYNILPACDPVESLLEYDALLHKINAIRAVAVKIWKQQEQGLVSLASASMTFNMAIQIVRSLENGFMEKHEKTFDCTEAIQKLVRKKESDAKLGAGGNTTMNDNKIIQVSEVQPLERSLDTDELNSSALTVDFEHMHIADWYLFTTLSLLPELRSRLQATLSLSGATTLAPFAPSKSNTATKVADQNRDKFDQSRARIYELASLIGPYISNKQQSFGPDGNRAGDFEAEDEATIALRTWFLGKEKLELWMLFAIQLLLDVSIHREGGQGKYKQEFSRRAGRHCQNIAEMCAFFGNPDAQWRFTPNSLRVMKIAPHYMYGDMSFLLFDKKLHPAHPGYLNDIKLQNPMLEANPLLCGTLIFRANMIYHTGELGCLNCFACSMFIAHLYNTMIVAGCLPAPWKEMELFISSHSEIFRSRPTTVDACAREFNTTIGYSAATGPNGQPIKLSKPSKDKRCLKSTLPFSDTFLGRYCFQNDKRVMDLPGLEKLLQQHNIIEGKVALSPVELLEHLCLAIDKEERSLECDLLDLEFKCFSILFRIQKDFVTRFPSLENAALHVTVQKGIATILDCNFAANKVLFDSFRVALPDLSAAVAEAWPDGGCIRLENDTGKGALA